MKKGNTLTIILISIIIVLVAILGYGVYAGVKVKAEINKLNAEKENLTSQLNTLTIKYGMLQDDVFELKKSCITQNACWGHFPGVRWNCNNVGDEVNDPSHICVCSDACTLTATPISQ